MRRWVACSLVAVAVLASCTSPDAKPRPGPPGPSDSPNGATGEASGAVTTPTGPTGATASPSGATGEPPPASLELTPATRRATFLVQGSSPLVDRGCAVGPTRSSLTGRYPGDLTVGRAEDGTYSVTVSLRFEDYLRGIAEVPASWPEAALEAQAIAARSYALASTGWTGEGNTLDEPICSTSSCQVYRGIPVSRSPGIGRWYRAVRDTRGQILVSDGRPATTFYFSTSNGRTFGNEDVFGGEPLPYLRPVTETDDGASSTSRWSVRLSFRDLARFLGAAGAWEAGEVTGLRVEGANVVVTGAGQERPLDVTAFRDAVNAWASCLAPGRYPQGGLPTTIPSIWFTAATRGHRVTLTGRGWGHGVGMVQWGAYGKAVRGWSAAEILSFYYGGFEPQPFPEPGVIEVQVASGLETLTITPSEPGALAGGEPFGGRRLVLGPSRGPLAERPPAG